MNRCSWVNNNPKMIEYHDTEWGVPVFDDQKIFEFLTLESAQAGLSWETVLKELVKTELLCANCHRVHHYRERNPECETLTTFTNLLPVPK